ncbi:hypothetical protein cypCar_00043584 [Cyprinus carpio]|nr:hypothetical protein cypCar_00043584 [Cyprinus carpio]
MYLTGGALAAIISSVGVAVLSAVSSYFAYQKKETLFQNSRSAEFGFSTDTSDSITKPKEQHWSPPQRDDDTLSTSPRSDFGLTDNLLISNV